AVVDDPGVVACEQRLGADAIGELEHRVEAYEPVAAHARIWRAATGMLVEEVVHDRLPKAVLNVERDVREAHRVPQRPGAQHRLRGEAAAGAVDALIGPEL